MRNSCAINRQNDSIYKSKRGDLMSLAKSIMLSIVFILPQLLELMFISYDNRRKDKTNTSDNTSGFFKRRGFQHRKRSRGFEYVRRILILSVFLSLIFFGFSREEFIEWNFFTCLVFLIIVIILFFILLPILNIFRAISAYGDAFYCNNNLDKICSLFFLELIATLIVSASFPITTAINNYIWLFHIIEIPILIWTLYELSTIVVSLLLNAMKENLDGSNIVVFRAVVATIVIQICILSSIMFHGLVISYVLNDNRVISNHCFEFIDNSENAESLLGGFDNNDMYADTVVINSETNTIKVQYLLLKSYYFVIITFSSVGYGDIVPYSGLAKIFSMFVSLNGYFMAAMIIGTVFGVRISSKTKSEDNEQRTQYEELMRSLSIINKQVSKLQTDVVKPTDLSPDNVNHDTEDNETDIVMFE